MITLFVPLGGADENVTTMFVESTVYVLVVVSDEHTMKV